MANVGSSAKFFGSGMKVISALVPGGFIGQSRVICQVLCIGIQVTSVLVPGGVGFPLAKFGSSARFFGRGMQVISALVLGVHWPEWVYLPGLVYWYLRHLCSGTGQGAIGQSRVICQGLCSGIQGISALVPWGSIGQSRVICQVLCSGIKVTSALVPGGSIGQSGVICQLLCTGIPVTSALELGSPLARVGLSAKFGVLVFKASLLWYWGGGHWPK